MCHVRLVAHSVALGMLGWDAKYDDASRAERGVTTSGEFSFFLTNGQVDRLGKGVENGTGNGQPITN